VGSEVESKQDDPLFAEGEVNQRALEILQSAENLGEATTADEPTTSAAEADEAIPVEMQNSDSAMPAGEAPVEVAVLPAPVVTATSKVDAGNSDMPQPIALVEPAQRAPANPVRVAGPETSSAASGASTSVGSRL